jgi:REP element-mobilizing transposase RayT
MLPRMPRPGMRWRLITINTKNSWHHGNPRGFRSRKHRIHSTGDYRNPPPIGEHAGLYIDRLLHSDQKVVLEREIRAIIGDVLVEWFKSHGYRVLAISVSSDHAHILIELIDDPSIIKRVIGEAKRFRRARSKHNFRARSGRRDATTNRLTMRINCALKSSTYY